MSSEEEKKGGSLQLGSLVLCVWFLSRRLPPFQTRTQGPCGEVGGGCLRRRPAAARRFHDFRFCSSGGVALLECLRHLEIALVGGWP